MGILDVIRGMQNGPRGPANPSSSGGPSTTTMALLALLAYKAWKSHSAVSQTQTQTQPNAVPSNTGGLGGLLGGLFGGQQNGQSGGLGGLGGLLGGAVGGGALGGLLGDGLRKLVGDMQSNGMGGQAQSWVGTGANQDISESDLAKAIGVDDLDKVSQQTGIPPDRLLSQLRTQLPNAVDELTPDGRIPTHQESSKWL